VTRPLLDVDDPVTLHGQRLAGLDAPVRIPMKRWDLGLPFALLVFVAIIGCFYVTVKNMFPHPLPEQGAPTELNKYHRYDAPTWWHDVSREAPAPVRPAAPHAR
jgi:hypothetical protein